MIDFDFDKYCYGCENCTNICPVNAITMVENKEGFLMPKVDTDQCVDCGLCDEACVYLREPKMENTLTDKKFYAMYAYSNKETLKKAASGGVFPELIQYAVANQWYVCGCIWNKEIEAVHIVTNIIEEMMPMLHSKYTQSRIGDVMSQVKLLLEQEETVLFSGTPCQIAGILLFTDNHPNLYTCDLICKGVPSPGVWQRYVQDRESKKGSKLKDIVLRSKHAYGWTGPVTRFIYENGQEEETLFFQLNTFIIGFLDGLFMRNSCYECQYKNQDHKADMVLGDFWGVSREIFKESENLGISAVIIQTQKGQTLMNAIEPQFQVHEVTYEDMVAKNPSMVGSTPHNEKRKQFYKNYDKLSITKNLEINTDIKSPRKRIIKFTYQTKIFALIKWLKTKTYRG